MRVSAAERRDLPWIVEATSCVLTDRARAIKAVDEHGQIRGMVAFDVWTPNACYAHMAVSTPIAWRSLLPAVFEYPFLECGREVILALIPADNVKSWGMASHLGFRIVHTVRDGWSRGTDLLLLEMRRDECRFLRRN